MIQLNDVFSTVINPFHIVYFNIRIDNPVIVGTIKCMFKHNCHLTLKYDSPEALKLDFNKLLTATNA
jgi:hypothetical protein